MYRPDDEIVSNNILKQATKELKSNKASSKKIKCNVCGNDSHVYLGIDEECGGDGLEIDINYDDTQNINVICPNCDNTGYISIKVVDIFINNDNEYTGDDDE